MAPNSIHWKKINLLLTLTFFTVIRSESSSVQDAPEKDNTGTYCPSGWMHYNRFCFARGRGASDRAVAFYCDGFGGIGIKGICVTRAKNSGDEEKRSSTQSTGPESLLKISLGLAAHGPTSERRHRSKTGELSDSTEILSPGDLLPGMSKYMQGVNEVWDENELVPRLCPVGWRHYSDICVYKPFTAEESCSRLGAVEFKGLCLKHADTSGLSEYKRTYQLGKRVCCCNHVTSRGNHYAC